MESMTRWFPENIPPIDVVNSTRESLACGIVTADEIAAELVFDFGIDASGLTADVVAAALRTGNLQGGGLLRTRTNDEILPPPYPGLAACQRIPIDLTLHPRSSTSCIHRENEAFLRQHK